MTQATALTDPTRLKDRPNADRKGRHNALPRTQPHRARASSDTHAAARASLPFPTMSINNPGARGHVQPHREERLTPHSRRGRIALTRKGPRRTVNLVPLACSVQSLMNKNSAGSSNRRQPPPGSAPPHNRPSARNSAIMRSGSARLRASASRPAVPARPAARRRASDSASPGTAATAARASRTSTGSTSIRQ